jgi:hypothetical protein
VVAQQRHNTSRYPTRQRADSSKRCLERPRRTPGAHSRLHKVLYCSSVSYIAFSSAIIIIFADSCTSAAISA